MLEILDKNYNNALSAVSKFVQHLSKTEDACINQAIAGFRREENK